MWHPDTAANYHYTPDLSHLSLESLPYTGTEEVSTGDGSIIPIPHYGSFLTSSFHHFPLNDLLHVPLVSQNYYLLGSFA